jgi:hypothetical protein
MVRRLIQVLVSLMALLAVSLVATPSASAAIDEFDTRSWCTTDAHPRLFFPFGGSDIPDNSAPAWKLRLAGSSQVVASGVGTQDILEPGGAVEIRLPAGLKAGQYQLWVEDTSIPDGLYVEAYDCVTVKVECAKLTFSNPSPFAASIDLSSSGNDQTVIVAARGTTVVRPKPGPFAWIAASREDGHFDDMGQGSGDIPACKSLTATPRPVLTGKPRVGQTLQANVGSWQPSPVTLTYRWKRNGAPIAGATGLTYKATKADVGKYLSFQVVGRKAGYFTSVQLSADTPSIKPVS